MTFIQSKFDLSIHLSNTGIIFIFPDWTALSGHEGHILLLDLHLKTSQIHKPSFCKEKSEYLKSNDKVYNFENIFFFFPLFKIAALLAPYCKKNQPFIQRLCKLQNITRTPC